MIEALAIVPHSPLILSDAGLQKREKNPLTEGFSSIAEHLEELGIKSILTVSAHPSFERRLSSLSVAQTYQLTFETFGDLITKQSLPVAHDLALFLRESITPPGIELIDHEQIDYGHAIPLLQLSKQFSSAYHPNILCLNLKSSQDLPELFTALERFDEPIALLLLGDLFITSQPPLTNVYRKKNRQLMKQLASMSLSIPENNVESKYVHAPCLTEPIRFIFPSAKGTFQLERDWKDEQGHTDFYLALYSRV